MPSFKCFKCGNSSLVRSNFKATPKHEYYCRGDIACAQRAKLKARKDGLTGELEEVEHELDALQN